MWNERTGAKGKHLSQVVSSKIVSEYDQEIPQSQTADKPMAPVTARCQKRHKKE